MAIHSNINAPTEHIKTFERELSSDLIVQGIIQDIKDIISGLYDLETMKRLSLESINTLNSERRFRIHKMFYRDYVWAHQKRIEAKILSDKDLLLQIFPDINFDYLLSLAKYHDLVEWISPTGDIPTPLKYWLWETWSSIFYRLELWCIDILSRFPPEWIQLARWFPLKFLLKDAMEKSTLEAQILSALYDKSDALDYCIHEVLWGNTHWWNKKESIYTHVIPRYSSFFKSIKNGTHPSYKELSHILKENADIISWTYIDPNTHIIDNTQRKRLKEKARIHTTINIEEDIWITSYQEWKKSVMSLENVKVWNVFMNGREMLTIMRG